MLKTAYKSETKLILLWLFADSRNQISKFARLEKKQKNIECTTLLRYNCTRVCFCSSLSNICSVCWLSNLTTAAKTLANTWKQKNYEHRIETTEWGCKFDSCVRNLPQVDDPSYIWIIYFEGIPFRCNLRESSWNGEHFRRKCSSSLSQFHAYIQKRK